MANRPPTPDPDEPMPPDMPDPVHPTPKAVDTRGNPVDVESFTNPMSKTGAVTEDRPVGVFVNGQARFPAEPSFGICEGTRAELAYKEEQAETDPKVKVEAISPFTGKTLTADSDAVGDYVDRNRAKES